MIRLSFDIELKYEIAEQPADFVFNIHAAHTTLQSVVNEVLVVEPLGPHQVQTEEPLGNRYLRLRAGPGPLAVRYGATVDIDHHRQSAALLGEVPIADIPLEVLPFIYPSRYCEADRLRRFAAREFGHLRPGYWRVQAIHDWVRQRTVFTPGTTNSSSSAMDTLVEQVGVCRDFAHLMIALCRAINIPARFVSGIDYGAAVQLGPPDFHAYVEAFLGDRWYLFDPTGITAPMGLVRIGTGRDAADISLATIFGAVRAQPPVIRVSALDDAAHGFELPQHSVYALSTTTAMPSEAA
jgi:transglutaminase-like putative cysteine protease